MEATYSKYSDGVIARYLAALGRMGDMYSRQTVSLVLTLATEEAVANALATWENTAEVEISQVRGQLAEISRLNVDLEAQRQDWQREAEEQRAAASSSFTRMEDLRTWLVTNDGDVTGDLVAAAIAKLNAQQDRIDALRAANETLHQRLALMPQPSNGHDAPASPLVVRLAGFDWSSLSPDANDYRIGIERGSHVFRRLPLTIRLEIVQCVLRQLNGGNATMADYEALKPEWMPGATGLPRTFGCGWTELVNLPAPVLTGV
jgi:hypothetical protein